VIDAAKGAIDGYIAIEEATKAADVLASLSAFKALSGYLGVAGALVGFVFSFFTSGPDPEILKLQEMIKETQTLIVLGNQEVLNAIRKLDSAEAQRAAEEAKSILDSLVYKHMVLGQEYEVGNYAALPCGTEMTLCNNAFVELSRRLDDIFGKSFEESPRGDKSRVANVANNLMQLLANSLYSLTWLNAKRYNETHPNEVVDTSDSTRVAQISQAETL